MYRIVPAILFCGVLALLTGSGCTDAPKTDGDIKLEKAAMEIKPEGTADVKVTAGKAKSAEADPKDKGVSATVTADKVTVKADKEAKDGEVTVKVTGEKGTASIKVTVKK